MTNDFNNLTEIVSDVFMYGGGIVLIFFSITSWKVIMTILGTWLICSAYLNMEFKKEKEKEKIVS